MGARERKMFGRRLYQLRVARGISQEQFAEIAGVHRNYVGRLERAEQNPSLDTIIVVARALRVKPAELFKGIR